MNSNAIPGDLFPVHKDLERLFDPRDLKKHHSVTLLFLQKVANGTAELEFPATNK